MTVDWPEAHLDPIRRAKVLAAALPASASAEGVLDALYRKVWPWVSDVEHSVHRFDSTVSKIVISQRLHIGHVVDATMTVTAKGVRLPFRARIEDGFCLMRARARLYVVIMAAVPVDDGTRTRFFHMEAVPLPMARGLVGLLQREVDHDFANLAAIAAAELRA